MGRWLALTAVAMVPIAILDPASFPLSFVAAILGLAWGVIFGAHAMAIVQETGRGQDAIEHWPLGGILPSGNPLFLPASLVVAVVPGLLIWVGYYLTREAVTIRGPIMLLVSAMVFTPLLWLPMLLEKSLTGPFHSPTFWQSFKDNGDGWIVFYLETLMLGLVASLGVSLWSTDSVVIAPPSAAIIVSSLMIYLRLLGRLLWYIDPTMTPAPPPPKAGPGPLPDTVDPTQLPR